MYCTAEGDISIREEPSPGIWATAGAREEWGGAQWLGMRTFLHIFFASESFFKVRYW